LADERPPAGGDATDFEAAAKAANAKAKKTTTRVRAAARETRAAQSEVDATARAADELARERERLNKEIQKVAHRLRSADRRMEGSELSTPANQERIFATYKKHSDELDRLNDQLGKIEAEENRRQAAREAPNVARRIGMKKTPKTPATPRRNERPDAEGSFEELERTAREQNARMAAALDPAGRRRLAARQAPVTDPAQQARDSTELEAAKTANRSALYQRLSTALARRVSNEEAASQAAADEAREKKIAREVERRKQRAEINAAAKARLASEEAAARVGPEHETTRERVQQARIDRNLTRARARQARAAEAAANVEVAAARQPGTELIRHPTEFGRRVPGPFGQVTETPAFGPPSDKPQPRTRAQGPRDVYAQRPRTAASSIGETRGEIAVYRSAAQAEAKAARAAQVQTAAANADIERHAQALAQATHAEQTYAQRLAESEQGMRRWSAQMGVVDQSMRRHGTFTTEFISAAAKGEVAYREWGWQIGAAAAKFGAWTAAGAGIYAALGAVSQIGQGAIQSASGVDSLKRSITDVNSAQAQQSFREQATHFNVPIETVVDAQTRMGAVFHNQADAATAATAALYALKTGQVDVAQSTKDLIAIQQAFGSSAGDLVGLFDELNYVQNNYGARIPDMETGIAGAAGAFKAMGGSMEDMVAMFTVLQRFGATGNVISTIFRRMPNELAKPGNRAVLRQYNIDPGADPMKIVHQAQAAVARGADPQTVAKALVGGQFAARFLNLLNHPELLTKVRGEIDPRTGRARGASETELGHVKDEAVEAIKAIGIELQSLGSNLAELGFATVIGTGVKALIEVLRLTNSILEIFNKWPAPLKLVAAYTVSGMAALAAARRLGIGGALEGTRARGAAPYLIESDPRRRRRLIGKGIEDAVKYANDQQERITAASFAATAERDRMVRAEGDLVRDTDRRLAAGQIDEFTANQRKAAAAAASADATEKAHVAAVRANSALDQTTGVYKQRAEFDALMAQTARRDRNAVAQRFAIERGLFIRPSLGADIPSPERVRLLQAPAGAVAAPAYPVPIGPPRQGQQFAAPIGPALRGGQYPIPIGPPRQGQQFAAPIGPLRESQAAANAAQAFAASSRAIQPDQAKRVLPQVRQALAGMTTTFRATASEAGLIAAVSQAGAVAARGAAIGVTAAGNGIRALFLGLNAMMGPIGWAIAGFSLLPSIISAVREQHRKTVEASRVPGELPDTKAALNAYLANINKERDDANSFMGTFWNSLKDTFDLPTLFRHGVGGGEKQRAQGRTTREQAAREQEAQVARARGEGRPAEGLSGQQIIDQGLRDVDAFKRGRIDLTELNKREQLRLKEILVAGASRKGASPGRAKDLEQQIKDLFDQSDEKIAEGIDARFNLLDSLTDDPLQRARNQVQRAQAKLAEARKGTDKDAITNALADLNNANRAQADAIKEDAEKRLAALGALVDSGAASRGQVQSYIAQQAALVARLQGSTDPEDMQKYANARQALLGAITNAGKSELDAALANARTPAQINKAYRDYERAGRSAARTAEGAARPEQPTITGGLRAGLAGGLGGFRGGVRPSETVDKGLLQQIRAARRAREQEIFEAKAELANAQTAVQAGRTEAGAPRLALQLGLIHKQVIGAIKAYGRYAKRTLELIVQEQQAQGAAIQYQATLIDAEASYAAAQAGTDQAAAARARIAGLERKLALARQHPEIEGLGDKASLLGLQAQILEARTQAAETIRQQANDLLDAQYALRASRNDDPVYRARLEAARTAAIVRRGGFSSPADKLRAQADANNALRDARDAAVQAKMEDIDFDVEIGKITTQQQIARYEELLKTAKMGQQQKKDLKRQIQRLRHESEKGSEDFSLDVGNIRLPSVYEVHRAIREGHDARNRTVVNNSPTVNVNVAPGDDGSGVIRALDNYLGTSARSAMRAAADIGV
jgi:hypothetical protein